MEYGAMIPTSGVVYMKGPLQTVAAWIAEYSTVTPLQLVQRAKGEIPGPWVTA
jgi:hypothetical protein